MRQILGPMAQGRRVKVGIVGPDKRMEVWVDAELCEELWIAKRFIDTAVKHWLKINGLRAAVVELQSQRKGGDLLTSGYTNDGVGKHG